MTLGFFFVDLGFRGLGFRVQYWVPQGTIVGILTPYSLHIKEPLL